MNLRREFRTQMGPLGLSLGVHLLIALLVVLGTINWKPFRQPRPVGLTIEAVIVDTSEILEQRQEAQRAAAEAERREREAERRQRELEAQREREAERQREQALEQQRQEALEEQRRRKEAQDRLQQLRMERERKREEERLRQQRELDRVRQEREAAERQRQLEEERLKQLEARKQAEAAEQRRLAAEAERQRQAEAERKAAQAGRIASLEDEYEAAIRQVVTQNWLRPPTAQAGLRCTLRIVQIPGGEIISANIAGSCNGDEATRRSIVAAVERLDALPYRGYEDVFKREITFIFRYDGD
ncbi:cell envelope integrity protein TolA [Elongatibacter sediminis]|uniref:Cell envelope integrity protein TolA n=1 Tax=Elongatibacter sediminis TaxID=3119006 RepID=A0AAW9RJ85_9GAMM